MITKIFTAYCADCSRARILTPEQSQVRQIAQVEAVGGERVTIVRCCAHISVLETFDIESDLSVDDAAQ